MESDPMVQEIRSIRDAIAREHGYDVKAIVRTLQREEAEAGRPLVALPAKHLPQEQAERKVG